MKNSRSEDFIGKTFRFLFLNVIFLSIIFGNVKNIQAESLSKLNFPKESIVEHLKLDVPKKFKNAWLKAEKGSWEPWLLKQDGFLGRQLFWDPKVEEATLLIGWESRAVWKNISQTEINLVQQDFEKIARKETGETSGNPFPLIFEGELNPE
ncbi:TIGR03792 family protein [Prochlorococcus marinus]|uniref:TIGR03792 family protein n=1 Tax=Prochlorococcus marinus XMU1408 TaxID=2213228 RepID=A0A318QXE8_PROMR|nr:TIGR03792 family protein [Prochlorococcus marinus]MBW3042460.1 TIGR03792 family protein [Prochlorococcus marinus str. XMU1408]PYE01195.1 TIGR03792 family protein [Prochlorococcus marinus XMU1408]